MSNLSRITAEFIIRAIFQWSVAGGVVGFVVSMLFSLFDVSEVHIPFVLLLVVSFTAIGSVISAVIGIINAILLVIFSNIYNIYFDNKYFYRLGMVIVSTSVSVTLVFLAAYRNLMSSSVTGDVPILPIIIICIVVFFVATYISQRLADWYIDAKQFK